MRVHVQVKVLEHNIERPDGNPLQAVGNLVNPGDVPNRSERRAESKKVGNIGLGLGRTELKRGKETRGEEQAALN
jgi:hypothetical protein